MRGIRTGIVLGAGASYCYQDGVSNIPTQDNIVGRLFFGAGTSSGEGVPSFIGPFGMKHSFQLGQYLRKKFEIPERKGDQFAKLDFWRELQERGYNLESLYAALEKEAPNVAPSLLEDFEAIARTAVAEPTGWRLPANVCRHHRMLCEALEPGDYIIDFNWDSVAADTLLYCCPFWYPMTGFGIPILGVWLPPGQKCYDVESLILLLHVHGSNVLYEPEPDDSGKIAGAGQFLGPLQYTPVSGFLALAGIDPQKSPGSSSIQASRPITHEEDERLAHGYIPFGGRWFRPVFVPPSKHKKGYGGWYVSHIRKRIHSVLPYTKHLVFAGYSFPDADLRHLSGIFVKEILDARIRVTVVNPSNGQDSFRARVADVLPSSASFDFSINDFKEYCSRLARGHLE